MHGPFSSCCLGLLLLTGFAIVRAEPEADVRAALRNLSRTSYAWETTVRQRSSGDAAQLKLAPGAAIEVTGKTDPQGNTEVTLLGSRDAGGVPVKAVFRFGDAVGYTPLGWLRRTEIHDSPGPDRFVDFDGQKVRLSKALAATLKAMALQTPGEEALDLIAEVKSWREADGLYIGDLRDAAIEKLWTEDRAKSAPELMGNLVLKIEAEVVTEYHLLLALGFPSRKQEMNWSVQQWTTRIKDAGSTVVDPPAAAVEKLKD
jgi:hypothetical protein